MKDNAAESNAATPEPDRVCYQSHRRTTYQKVRDARKRPIRGLWVRNGRFYARLSIEDSSTGRKAVRRVPLEGCQTTAQAQTELRRLLAQREENNLPVLKRVPKFCDFMQEYLDYYEVVKDAKRPRTLGTERGHLRQWAEHLGDTRLDRITRAMINGAPRRRREPRPGSV